MIQQTLWNLEENDPEGHAVFNLVANSDVIDYELKEIEIDDQDSDSEE